MNQGSDPDSSRPAEPRDPYERLGVPQDSSCELVQQSRDARLAEVGDDPMARSRIEAAYDAVLMNRLKERQQGRVSTAARSASQREDVPPPAPRPSLAALPQLPRPRLPAGGVQLTPPALDLASGRERWLPLVADGVLLVVLLAAPGAPAEVLLALATVVSVVNLQRRNGRFLAAVGWSVLLLCVGLLLGGLLLGALNGNLPLGLPLTAVQVQSLPALLLLLLGALLIA
jgi:hypothetical protein